ncbi:DUF2017 domain-containing protein [Spirillospora albida]|uniref:DUF2017 domain-containing protein n=1 Tax=Spirillospora albida TaxID=58123 RepID=UPI0004C1B3EA|nr:DUF2017 domain-containing protein [Spirillospora albida]
MSRVRRTPDGVAVELEAAEASLVRTLMEQLIELLGETPGAGGELASVGIAEDAALPDDPVLARLFPDAYRDDGEAAGEFRRYTEIGLRDGKRDAANAVLSSLKAGAAHEDAAPGGGDAEVLLTPDEAQAWLRAVNDLRLALGTRLDIGEEWYEELDDLDPRDPRLPMFAAYDWLTMLQESLVRAVW